MIVVCKMMHKDRTRREGGELTSTKDSLNDVDCNVKLNHKPIGRN